MKLTLEEIIQLVQSNPPYISMRFGIHGRPHSNRVLLFANMLAAMVQSREKVQLDMEAITIAALLHDSMRVRDGHDPNHALNSAKAAKEFIKKYRIDCDTNKIFDIIVRHCPPQDYKFSRPATFESMIIGDADKLDRFRFYRQSGPDIRFFELPESRSLMDIASRVNGHWWRSFLNR